MQDATVRWEGLKKDAFWAFNLSSSDGVQLLRLSSDKQDIAQHWVKVSSELCQRQLECLDCQHRPSEAAAHCRRLPRTAVQSFCWSGVMVAAWAAANHEDLSEAD